MKEHLLMKVQTAGALLISGVTIWIIGMITSEALYPGYSVKTNYISDLGVGPWPSDILLNGSTMLFGLCVVAAAFILIQNNANKPFLYGMIIAGIGAFGVGLLPETTGLPHELSAGITFIIGSLAAIEAGRWMKRPYRYFCILMGVIGIASFFILVTDSYGALGPGGIERLIAYPLALWLLSYGGYLVNEPEEPNEPAEPYKTDEPGEPQQ